MGKGRLEAYSDAVMAILITIMVLELKVPHGTELAALKPLIPVFLSYLLSFIYLGIYWNNHHHLLHVTKHVTGAVMWANHHLLFWLSLVPFVTGWMGENHYAAVPTAMYGFVLLMCAMAWWVLQHAIVRSEGKNSVLAAATRRDYKGNLSPVFYIAGIGAAFVNAWISGMLYAMVALIWLIPDRRIERELTHSG